MSMPSIMTCPRCGLKAPLIRLNSVDLPAPLGPITVVILCRCAWKLT
jgi:hypothetical protein